MDRAIPEVIHPLLQDYLQLLNQHVPNLVVACYLHGSIALKAFNERWSDIDFISVCDRRPNPQDIIPLETIHRTLLTQYPNWKLDGSYLQWSDLGCLPDAIAPSPYVADGVFYSQGYRDINLVTWWVLKHRGIAILGQSPQSLSFNASWDELVARMHGNLNTYWRSWTRSPVQFAKLLADYGVQWSVLGVLRLWYAFRENDITSKTAVGRYALIHLPEQWHPIVREAISLRDECDCPKVAAQSDRRVYTCRIRRAYDTVNFLRYIIRLCNDSMLTGSWRSH